MKARFACAAILFGFGAVAQTPAEWLRPYAPFKIVSNVYYVGTADLACYLITGNQGHILINTPLAESTDNLLENIAKLGFKPEDIKILLTNQAHHDHVAGFAEVQRRTGVQVFATPPDAVLLENGGVQKGVSFPGYKPVKVARRLNHDEVIRLGDIALKVHHHYGHSPGSSSYEMTLPDGRTLLFANMGTVVVSLDSYPTIVKEYETTFDRQKKLNPDIWVAAHAAQFDLAAKQKAGSFEDKDGYKKAVEKHEQRFLQQRKIETGK